MRNQMRNIWKRSLSAILAFVMVLSMLPGGILTAFAADDVWQIDDPTTTPTKAAPTGEKVPNSVWVLDKGTTLNPNPKRVCAYSSEHTHSDDCYKLSCDHQDGHGPHSN